MGLTKLNSIIGKPNKADFINKSEEVIDFAQEVLKSENIEEIESNINHRIDFIEQKKEEEKERVRQEELEHQKEKLLKT